MQEVLAEVVLVVGVIMVDGEETRMPRALDLREPTNCSRD